MRGFTVAPDELRSTASVIGYAVEVTEPVHDVSVSSHLGHAGLADAVARFMQAMTGGWMQNVAETEGLASTLTACAALYEDADGGSVADIGRADVF